MTSKGNGKVKHETLVKPNFDDKKKKNTFRESK